MSPNRFRKIVVLLCLFSLLFVIFVIIGFNRLSFVSDNVKPAVTFHKAKQNHPYWMPEEVDDMEIEISRPSLGKHPILSDALKIWPYKGLSSETLDFRRAIRDIRPFGCDGISYDHQNDLKPVSIVIAFHNEFLGVLLRTIYAIVEMTPSHLLLEIILVDDASTEKNLQELLETEADNIVQDKIRILRLSKRQGIHRAQKIGLDKVKAKIVVIMPSYLEPSKGWLEPLLDPVINDRRTISTPVVQYQHWSFNENGSHEILEGRGVFDLRMNLIELPVNISIKNFESPIITTRIVVGTTEFIKQVSNKKAISGVDGNYLELSLKTWLCLDGRITKVPCARFSHSYKEMGVHNSLANVGKAFKDRELKRIILKYFDDYSEKFLNIVPGRFGKMVKSSKSGCTPFKHFLETVAPDMAAVFIETPPKIISGVMFNGQATEMCIDTSSPSIGAVLGLINCTNSGKRSTYTYTKASDIRLVKKNLCWNASGSFKYQGQNISLVTLQSCNTLDDNQKFEYDMKSKAIKKIASKYCLDAIVKRNSIVLAACDETSLTQRWNFR